jgi:hypothetical protein
MCQNRPMLTCRGGCQWLFFLRVGRTTYWPCAPGGCALVGSSLLLFPLSLIIAAILLLKLWVVVAVCCKFSELVVFLVHSHWLMELIRSNLRLDKCSIWVVLRLQLNYCMVIVLVQGPYDSIPNPPR